MTATDSRWDRSGESDTSTPSSSIAPLRSGGATSRVMACTREDFPDPVRPTTPTFSPGAMVAEMPLSTSGRPSRYRSFTLRSTSSLAAGGLTSKPAAACGACWPEPRCRGTHPGSGSSSWYDLSRSTEMRCASTSHACRTDQLSVCVTCSASVRPSAAVPTPPAPRRPAATSAGAAAVLRAKASAAAAAEMSEPSSSSRSPSQQLTSAEVSEARRFSSRAASHCTPKRRRASKARMVGKPSREDATCDSRGARVAASMRLSSRDEEE
mmetsp:Transcript_6842/g.22415  ORF Transcript_6842/g.22415 Transcript_6842/m.22415 type:complete len:267 (-) Transcript_6842:2958-3758(-)